MTGGQVELAVLPAGALWFAGHPDLLRRIAVDYRDQLAVGLEIGDPPTADADKPQISLVVEGAAFEKLALRSIADIGEFLDRSDPRWQRRQTPWLHRAGVGRLRRCLGDGRTDGGADGPPAAQGPKPRSKFARAWRCFSRLDILAVAHNCSSPVQYLSSDRPSRRFMTDSVAPRRSIAAKRTAGLDPLAEAPFEIGCFLFCPE